MMHRGRSGTINHGGHRGHRENHGGTVELPALNDVTGQVVDCAIHVHSRLGPGLLESAYHACLAHELRKRGLKVLSDVELPVIYDEVTIELGYRIDLIVENTVVV